MKLYDALRKQIEVEEWSGISRMEEPDDGTTLRDLLDEAVDERLNNMTLADLFRIMDYMDIEIVFTTPPPRPPKT